MPPTTANRASGVRRRVPCWAELPLHGRSASAFWMYSNVQEATRGTLGRSRNPSRAILLRRLLAPLSRDHDRRATDSRASASIFRRPDSPVVAALRARFQALVNLAPTLPADGPHDCPALIRRKERRADFAPLDAMRGILVLHVGFRFLALCREGAARCRGNRDTRPSVCNGSQQLTTGDFRRIKPHYLPSPTSEGSTSQGRRASHRRWCISPRRS